MTAPRPDPAAQLAALHTWHANVVRAVYNHPDGVHIMQAATSHQASGQRPQLTPRQLAALRLAAAGHTTAAIATRLSVGDAGVRDLLHYAYRRLGARDRAHAVALAILAGLIGPTDIRQETIR